MKSQVNVPMAFSKTESGRLTAAAEENQCRESESLISNSSSHQRTVSSSDGSAERKGEGSDEKRVSPAAVVLSRQRQQELSTSPKEITGVASKTVSPDLASDEEKQGHVNDSDVHDSDAEIYNPELLFDESELRALAEVFDSFDKDGNGSIDKGEIKLILRSAGFQVSHKQLSRLINLVDINQNESLEWGEFLTLVHKLETDSEFGHAGADVAAALNSVISSETSKISRQLEEVKSDMARLMEALSRNGTFSSSGASGGNAAASQASGTSSSKSLRTISVRHGRGGARMMRTVSTGSPRAKKGVAASGRRASTMALSSSSRVPSSSLTADKDEDSEESSTASSASSNDASIISGDNEATDKSGTSPAEAASSSEHASSTLSPTVASTLLKRVSFDVSRDRKSEDSSGSSDTVGGEEERSGQTGSAATPPSLSLSPSPSATGKRISGVIVSAERQLPSSSKQPANDSASPSPSPPRLEKRSSNRLQVGGSLVFGKELRPFSGKDDEDDDNEAAEDEDEDEDEEPEEHKQAAMAALRLANREYERFGISMLSPRSAQQYRKNKRLLRKSTSSAAMISAAKTTARRSWRLRLYLLWLQLRLHMLRSTAADRHRLWLLWIALVVVFNWFAVPFRLAFVGWTGHLAGGYWPLFCLALDAIAVISFMVDAVVIGRVGYSGATLRADRTSLVKKDSIVRGSLARDLQKMLQESSAEQMAKEESKKKASAPSAQAGTAARLAATGGALGASGEQAVAMQQRLWEHQQFCAWTGVLLDLVPCVPWHRLLPLLVSLAPAALVQLLIAPVAHVVFSSDIVTDDGTPIGIAWSGVCSFLLLLQLLKTARAVGAAAQVEKRLHANPAALRLMHLVFLCFLMAHWVGCGWALMGVWERGTYGVDSAWLPDSSFAGEGALSSWLRSLYWGFSTITGGSATEPETMAEVIYSFCVLFLGMSVYATIIGNVGSLLSNLDRAAVDYGEKLDRIQAYLRYRDIPSALQDRVLDYYEYVFSTSGGIDEAALLADLPTSIRTDIALFLNHEVIKKVPFLRGASNSFISVLVRLLKSDVCAPGEYVIRYGDVGKEMYFINRGVVSVISADGQRIFNVLREGSFFGEYALLYSQTRTASIRSETYCNFFVLKQDDFLQLLEDYPEFEVVVRRHGLARIILKIPMFSDLSEDCIEALLDCLTPETFQAGSDVVTQGDPGDSMYFLVKGTAEVIINNKKVVNTLKDGEFFGELALLFDKPRTASVRAVTHIDAFSLSRDDFNDVMEDFPQFNALVRARAAEKEKGVTVKASISKVIK